MLHSWSLLLRLNPFFFIQTLPPLLPSPALLCFLPGTAAISLKIREAPLEHITTEDHEHTSHRVLLQVSDMYFNCNSLWWYMTGKGLCS